MYRDESSVGVYKWVRIRYMLAREPFCFSPCSHTGYTIQSNDTDKINTTYKQPNNARFLSQVWEGDHFGNLRE